MTASGVLGVFSWYRRTTLAFSQRTTEHEGCKYTSCKPLKKQVQERHKMFLVQSAKAPQQVLQTQSKQPQVKLCPMVSTSFKPVLLHRLLQSSHHIRASGFGAHSSSQGLEIEYKDDDIVSHDLTKKRR